MKACSMKIDCCLTFGPHCETALLSVCETHCENWNCCLLSEIVGEIALPLDSGYITWNNTVVRHWVYSENYTVACHWVRFVKGSRNKQHWREWQLKQLTLYMRLTTVHFLYTLSLVTSLNTRGRIRRMGMVSDARELLLGVVTPVMLPVWESPTELLPANGCDLWNNIIVYRCFW